MGEIVVLGGGPQCQCGAAALEARDGFLFCPTCAAEYNGRQKMAAAVMAKPVEAEHEPLESVLAKLVRA